MKDRDVIRELREADRFSTREMEGLELGPAESSLAAEILAQPEAATVAENVAPAWTPVSHRRRGLVGVAGLTAAAVVAALILLLGGSSGSASRAYGAELVRFAESTPLLLLEGPGWRVQNVYQADGREGLEGSMEFVTGKPIPYESIRVSGDADEPRASGMQPPATRQRRVELMWSQRNLDEEVKRMRSLPHPHGRQELELPVLGTTATVDARAEFYVNQGGPGNREMVALWSEGGYLLELRAAVPDLKAFEERLGWLTKVDSQTWLDAMPAKVVKAADHDGTVREMLKGIPVPGTFAPSRVPSDGLTTNRYQVGAAVTGTVTCLWFRQWGQARRTGDPAAEAEAERAMATSKRWPILREMAADGGYSEVVWELARDMPSGVWEWAGRKHRLLPRAEGLGCAHLGIPVLPWKQRRQNERAEASGRSPGLRP